MEYWNLDFFPVLWLPRKVPRVSETNARASSRLAISRIIFDSLRFDGVKFRNIVKVQYMKNLSSRLQSCLVDILFLLSIITLFLD